MVNDLVNVGISFLLGAIIGIMGMVLVRKQNKKIDEREELRKRLLRVEYMFKGDIFRMGSFFRMNNHGEEEYEKEYIIPCIEYFHDYFDEKN